jgi:hypothetical protein
MSQKITSIDSLPTTVPLFPLAGGLLLPRGELPLNIFEERYIAMVDAALSSPRRLIGLIQPRSSDRVPADLYSVGCVGRINSFHETEDHRYLITLSGVCRFRFIREDIQCAGYRCGVVDYRDFVDDLGPVPDARMDRIKLFALLKSYFDVEGLMCNWENIQKATDDTLVTILSMACPFEPAEKQAILEAENVTKRAEIFMMMLEMAVISAENGTDLKQVH